MYLKKILINNIGPFDELNIDFPFHENGNPKPIIFVGENGSGKTIILSPIIDALYEYANKLFSNDILPKMGTGYTFYKYSGGINVKVGLDYGFAALRFIQGNDKHEYLDKNGNFEQQKIANKFQDFSLFPLSNPGTDNQKLTSNLNAEQKKTLESEFINGPYFYLPAYRFEEPFWKNKNINSRHEFTDNIRFANYLQKEIESLETFQKNKAFLLDLVLDFFINDADAKIKFSNVNEILRKIKKKENIQLSIGPRGSYRVSISEVNNNQNMLFLPSIDNLSLGETMMLDMFLNILRHSDSSRKPLNEIEGIVIIDEIDIHLHINLQKDVLPNLIKLFPKIQFIITSHAPFFLLGMEKIFETDNFEIINLPYGNKITAERFSEFENAYESLKETEQYDEELKKIISIIVKPVVFVEGDYDIKYLKKAAELLGKQDIIEQINLKDGGGFGNLNNIWKYFDSKYCDITPQNILLLYDCDMNKPNNKKGRVSKKIIPITENNPIKKGIENLFDKTTLEKAMRADTKFIDVTSSVTKKIRGKDITEPEKYEVNKDEKLNLCEWLCNNGTKEDFEGFNNVFLKIEEFLRTEEQENN
jgi:predicted ATP-binding protein involved in virulence